MVTDADVKRRGLVIGSGNLFCEQYRAAEIAQVKKLPECRDHDAWRIARPQLAEERSFGYGQCFLFGMRRDSE